MGPSPLAAVKLVRPLSYSERLDVRTAIDEAGDSVSAQIRVLAGAIGVCGPRLRRRLPYRGRLLEHGGLVLDKLMTEYTAAGWDDAAALSEIGKLGAEAVRLCTFPAAAAVEEALGNSEAPDGA